MDLFWTSVSWVGIAIGALLALHGVIGLMATLWWPRLLDGRLFNERAIGRGPRTRERLYSVLGLARATSLANRWRQELSCQGRIEAAD